MVELRTELNPLRLVLGKSKKVELMIQITNDSDKARLMSCDILLSNQMAFEKQGRTNAQSLMLGNVSPGERIIRYLQIFPRMSIEEGEQPVFVTVMEHYEDKYDYILSKKTKKISLRVE